MIRKFALFLSYLFHPLLLTTLLIGSLYLYIPEVIRPINPDTIRQIMILISALTFVIPLCSILVMKLLGSIESLHMRSRKERILPFFFIGIYYSVTTYLFVSRLPFSDVLLAIFGGVTLLIFISTFITLFMKISIHSAGIWGIVGFTLALHLKVPVAGLFIPMIVSLLLAGVVSSSRLFLNEHTPRQVYVGAVTGFLICFSAMFLIS